MDQPTQAGPAASGQQQPGSKDMADWKPGSEAAQARDVAAPGDFGVPVGAGPSRERDYVSNNTRMSDPGMTQPFAWEADGVRDHGAGARNSGPGSASGGDVDVDVIGVGTGGTSVAATGPDDTPGPDDSDGTSNEFASPVPKTHPGQAIIEPASGRNQTGVGQVGGSKQVRHGTVIQGLDMQSGTPNQGADAATNPAARGDDSFAGEISSGEATGQDNSMAPSQETQGLVPGDNQVDGQKDFPDTDSD